MRSILFLLLACFFTVSVESKTILSVLGTTEKKDLLTEVENIFQKANWGGLFIASESSNDKTWDYKLEVSLQNNIYQLSFYANDQIEPIYATSTPLALKKNSLENFEKYLTKRKFQDNLFQSQNEDKPKVKLFSDKSRYTIGEGIEVGFETTEKGFVYLVLFSNNGNDFVLLYPNDTQKERELPASTKILLGDAQSPIKASRPLGKEIVKAFHFAQPWNQIKLKKIPQSRFHWILPKTDSRKSTAGDSLDFSEKIKSSSDLSWEIIAK